MFEGLLDSGFKYLSSYITTSSDKTALWLSLFLLFFGIYVLIIWFTDTSKSTAIAIAFLPVLILDWIFSFGKYVFNVPILGSYTTDRFVVSLNLIDFILNFGIFKNIGLPVFNTVTGNYILTGNEQALVWLFVLIDSIIDFIIFYYIAEAFTDRTDLKLLVATIPTALYSIFISNPLNEYKTAEATVKHALFFNSNASPEQFIIVVSTVLLSFGIIVFLLSIITSILESAAKTTVKPGWQAKEYEYSFTGIAFGLAVVYSIAQILHPNYAWYVIIPVMVLYSVIRGSIKEHADQKRDEKRQKQMFREAMRE